MEELNLSPEVEAQTPDPSQAEIDPTAVAATETPKQKIGEPRPKTGVAPGTETTPAPAYQANYKFKAHGKEHEIPEIFRSVIKDKDTEKYVHDMFEKAYGLGPIKQRFQETRERYQQLESTHNEVMGQIEEARNAYKRNDLDSMFEIFQVPQDKVLQWAVEKVQLSQMPPEQRQALDRARDAEKRLYEQEKTSRSYTQEQMQVQQEHLRQMLDLVLERPDISAAAQAYDARLGRKENSPSFRDVVVQIGRSEHALSGKFLTPLEAAQKALELLGEMPAAPEKAATPPASATPANPQQPKKTLPNLTGQGTKNSSAPAKAPPKSLDDLKRRYDELAAQKQ